MVYNFREGHSDFIHCVLVGSVTAPIVKFLSSFLPSLFLILWDAVLQDILNNGSIIVPQLYTYIYVYTFLIPLWRLVSTRNKILRHWNRNSKFTVLYRMKHREVTFQQTARLKKAI